VVVDFILFFISSHLVASRSPLLSFSPYIRRTREDT
jgi:hypothetical protein